MRFGKRINIWVGKNSTEKRSVDTFVKSNTIDFIELSKNSAESYFGYLAGVEKSDSSGPYVIRQYFSDTLSFQLLFYPKKLEKGQVGFENVEQDATNKYENFECFAFVYRITEPSKMKNYHEDNATYPLVVKSYIRKSRSWKFIAKFEVNNLTELSNSKIKCIYSNL